MTPKPETHVWIRYNVMLYLVGLRQHVVNYLVFYYSIPLFLDIVWSSQPGYIIATPADWKLPMWDESVSHNFNQSTVLVPEFLLPYFLVLAPFFLGKLRSTEFQLPCDTTRNVLLFWGSQISSVWRKAIERFQRKAIGRFQSCQKSLIKVCVPQLRSFVKKKQQTSIKDLKSVIKVFI